MRHRGGLQTIFMTHAIYLHIIKKRLTKKTNYKLCKKKKMNDHEKKLQELSSTLKNILFGNNNICANDEYNKNILDIGLISRITKSLWMVTKDVIGIKIVMNDNDKAIIIEITKIIENVILLMQRKGNFDAMNDCSSDDNCVHNIIINSLDFMKKIIFHLIKEFQDEEIIFRCISLLNTMMKHDNEYYVIAINSGTITFNNNNNTILHSLITRSIMNTKISLLAALAIQYKENHGIVSNVLSICIKVSETINGGRKIIIDLELLKISFLAVNMTLIITSTTSITANTISTTSTKANNNICLKFKMYEQSLQLIYSLSKDIDGIKQIISFNGLHYICLMMKRSENVNSNNVCCLCFKIVLNLLYIRKESENITTLKNNANDKSNIIKMDGINGIKGEAVEYNTDIDMIHNNHIIVEIIQWFIKQQYLLSECNDIRDSLTTNKTESYFTSVSSASSASSSFNHCGNASGKHNGSRKKDFILKLLWDTFIQCQSNAEDKKGDGDYVVEKKEDLRKILNRIHIIFNNLDLLPHLRQDNDYNNWSKLASELNKLEIFSNNDMMPKSHDYNLNNGKKKKAKKIIIQKNSTKSKKKTKQQLQYEKDNNNDLEQPATSLPTFWNNVSEQEWVHEISK